MPPGCRGKKQQHQGALQGAWRAPRSFPWPRHNGLCDTVAPHAPWWVALRSQGGSGAFALQLPDRAGLSPRLRLPGRPSWALRPLRTGEAPQARLG